MFPIEDIAARHGVSIDTAKPANSKGLDSAVAAQRLIENGPNILSPPKQISPFMKFFHCLTSLFNLLLILAGVLNYILLAVAPQQNQVNVSFFLWLSEGVEKWKPCKVHSPWKLSNTERLHTTYTRPTPSLNRPTWELF